MPWTIPGRHSRNIRSPPRYLAGSRISIRSWTRWFACRRADYGQSLRSTTAPRERRMPFGWSFQKAPMYYRFTTGHPEALTEGPPESAKPAVVLPRSWMVAVAALSLLLAAALGVIAILAWGRKTGPATVVANEGVARAFPIFWKSFVAGPEEPLVIFSNAAFVG